ncbi:MAG: NAD-dependent succinate-semialdehyde dehydrogenase [Candidatus Binatia bacterium]
MDDLRTELSIDGTWRPAADGARFAVHEPATGAELAQVADATVADGLAAVAAAHDAARAWAATAPRQRSDVLRRAFELMLARADRLAELIVRENGKPIAEARGEVAYAAEFLRWFSEEAVRLNGRLATAPGGGNRMLVTHQPVGVALLVTPWNFPAAMATRKIGPALAAGCPVVLKPATETPLTALALAAILAEAGAPRGVVNVVPTARNAAVVAAMLADARVRKLSFTGSTAVGRLLLAQAAQRVVKCSMELGGNAPFVVFADADLDAAVAGALVAKMRHNGEACTADNRFYVERPAAEDFSRRLATAMGELKMGNGLDPDVRVGPLVNEATRAKVTRLVDAAIGAGARLRTGGVRPDGPGFFYPATVLDRVASDSPILAEEIFGPVAPVVAFDDADEAIHLANATEAGLVSYVFTRDLARGLRVAEQLDAGMVGINRGVVSDPAAPFGGMKQSGLGREGGPEGILEYTETKYIAAQW